MVPPTDPVFTNGAGAPAASTTSTQGTPTASTTTPSGGASLPASVDLDARIAAAISPLTKSLSAVEEFMRQTSEHLQATRAPQAPTSPSGDEWMNSFYTDPKGAVQATVNETAGPVVGQVAQAHADIQLDRFASQIDSKWGAGAYEAVIGKPMSDIVNRAIAGNPTSVLNPEAMRSTLDSLVGRHVDALAAHRETATTTASETQTKDFDASVLASFQRQGIDPTSLSGGIRRTAAIPEKLGDEYHEYLAGALRDGGRKIDEKRAAIMLHSNIDTLAGWQEANEKAEGKKA